MAVEALVRLLHDGLIDERAHELGVVSPERRLHHRDDHHLHFGIGPPVGRERTEPEVSRRSRDSPTSPGFAVGNSAAKAGVASKSGSSRTMAWMRLMMRASRVGFDARNVTMRQDLLGCGSVVKSRRTLCAPSDETCSGRTQ